MASNFYFVTILFLAVYAVYIEGRVVKRELDSHETEDTGNKPRVFLTVSSLASHPDEEDRMLELNWYNIPMDTTSNNIEWIRLYTHDPRDDIEDPVVSILPTSEEYYRTKIQFPRQNFHPNNLTDDCLGFWIAYINNSEVSASSCLRARPHWMYQAQSAIGRLSLADMMLPGTHNAGCYAPFDPDNDSIFKRYLITQEESVWNQLVYGIRYIDLRVAYQSVLSSPEHFWITHSHFRTDISVRDVIEQVKAFLNVTNEIVIMDFHRFVTGFTGRRAAQRHRELISLLEQELSEYMIPISLSPWATLNELWSSNKRLYVGYAAKRERQQSPLLFPAIRHLWGDVDLVTDLYNYLNNTVCTRRRLTSAMAQLTPTTTGAIFNAYGGLRNMADSVNHHVSKWFRDEWRDCSNIVATDFFLGNDMIDISIETNKNKFSDIR